MGGIELLTVGEAARILRVNPHTVYRLVKAKKLKSYKIGRDLRFTEKHLRDYLESGVVETA